VLEVEAEVCGAFLEKRERERENGRERIKKRKVKIMKI